MKKETWEKIRANGLAPEQMQENQSEVEPGSPSVFKASESRNYPGVRCLTLSLAHYEESKGKAGTQDDQAKEPQSDKIRVLSKSEIESLRQETKAAMAMVSERIRNKPK